MEKKRKYWLFITNEDNWKTIKKYKIYGFKERNRNRIKELNKDDLVIIYIKAKTIGGLFKIESLECNLSINFKNGSYPYKIKLKKIKVPLFSPILLREDIDKISLFKKRHKWGVFLMGRSIVGLNKKDFEVFSDLLGVKC